MVGPDSSGTEVDVDCFSHRQNMRRVRSLTMVLLRTSGWPPSAYCCLCVGSCLPSLLSDGCHPGGQGVAVSCCWGKPSGPEGAWCVGGAERQRRVCTGRV